MHVVVDFDTGCGFIVGVWRCKALFTTEAGQELGVLGTGWSV